MQKNHTPKNAPTASASAVWSDISGLTNKLERVEEVLGALYLMTDSIEEGGRRRSFKIIVETAEEELAYAMGFIENDAARLRLVAEKMRDGQRNPTKPDAANLASPSTDPLSSAIADYQRGEDAFNAISEADWPAMGGESVVIAQTYGPPMAVLEDWEKPAMTRAAALEALRLAHAENKVYDSSAISKAMVSAALAFFEGEAV